jgi:hypothetical protein
VSIREQILNADDIETELVEVPAWGVTVEIRSMDGRSRTRLLKSASDNDGVIDMERMYPEMVILCSFDPESGERIFTADDVDALLSKSAAPLELLATSAMRVSGMTGDAVEVAGKDSPSITSDDSSTN